MPDAAETQGTATIASSRMLPLIVDLHETLLATDTLYESFSAAVFARPLDSVAALARLVMSGKAVFKSALADLDCFDAAVMPVRVELLNYLKAEKARGRELHLATAADRSIADAVAYRFGIFSSVMASGDGHNLKGANKAARLVEAFPEGFVYAGDAEVDLAVWKQASAAIVVSHDTGLAKRLAEAGTPVERAFAVSSGSWRDWARAARPHQWAKNALVLVPSALGLMALTPVGFASALAAMLLLCILASLTYMLNDISDLGSDRRHWSKSKRPFASGALPVKNGLLVTGVGIPLAVLAGFLISVGTGLCLLAYLVVTLSYSFGLKRVPLLDVGLIATLFSLRLALGMTAAGLEWSPWLLTFSMFFFFSLAIAKRHTELLRTAKSGSGDGSKVHGRGYHVEDNDVTFVFGICAAFSSIIILLLYLAEEAFHGKAYTSPQWLWCVPPLIFLWTGRIWLLSHRGQMTDDPVIFALRDRISLVLGLGVGTAFLLALIG